MKFYFFVITNILGTFCWALDGNMYVNSNQSIATVILTESKEDGLLSQLFEKIAVKPVIDGSQRNKTFISANRNFSLECHKGYFQTVPPSTSCMFMISTGNSSNTAVNVSTASNKLNAELETKNAAATELIKTFSLVASGDIALKAKNGIQVLIQKSAPTSLSIFFSN